MQEHRRLTQKGQVMPMTVIFIVAVILALWVMYDSGSVMSDKIRLQNTADNVAYSTATLVSRDLNFIAYTNRGLVANQIGIAQMVGVSSWAASIEQLFANLNTIFQNTPFGAFSGGALTAATAVSNFIDEFAEFMIDRNNDFSDGITRAQSIFHGAIVLQIPDMARDVADRNEPDAYALLSVGAYSFSEAASVVEQFNEQIGAQYQRHATSDDSEDARLENSRYRDLEGVVLGSRGQFTRNRSYEWELPFTVPLLYETQKYGGNEFFRYEDPSDEKYRWDWTAMETVSFRFIHCGIDGCEKGPEVPLTWGAAHALDEDEASDFSDYGLIESNRRAKHLWGQGTWRNSASATLLNTSPASSEVTGGKDHINHRIASSAALRPFYEFRSNDIIDTGPEIIALYAKDEGRVNSQNSIMTAGGGVVATDIDTDRDGGLASNRLGAIAKAQPYYARPTDLDGWRRRDNRIEHGSLYNPYWQTRLIELSNAEKLAATEIIGGVVLTNNGGSR